MTTADAPKAPVSPAVDFLAGTVAGVASLLTGHPFDTVKVRLQTQTVAPTSSIGGKGGEPYYRNARHAFLRILKEEKLSGVYKGVTSPMLGVAVMNASVFTSYKFAMTKMISSPSAEPTLGQIALAGGTSGTFTSVITTPIERLKILQQSSSVGSSASSPSILSLVRSLPLTSLYRGLLPTILRDAGGYAAYFTAYEYFVRVSWGEVQGKRRKVKADLAEEVESELFGSGEGGDTGAGMVRVLVAGGLAGIAGWGVTFPLDVIKTKMQSLPYSPPPISSASALVAVLPPPTFSQTLASTWQASGWRGFVSGLGPTLLRGVPVNMVTFAAFELVVTALR